MRILLIRHAEPDYSVDSLTPKGRVEAELLSRRLVRYNIRDFYVSPLGRAKDTAAYTLDKLGRTAEVLPWLMEFHGRCIDPETGREHLPWDLPPRFWSALPGAYEVARWTDAPLFEGTDVKAVWQETVDGMKELGVLTDCSPLVLWHRNLTLPSSVTEVVTEERIRGEVSFRITRLGDITHLEANGEKRSTAGLFPECFTGIDSTDPAVNGTSGTETPY